jgi:uncharacterized protein YbbC (DUF1343 family)/CubicO group peptidase (beta-lactamase class C family)
VLSSRREIRRLREAFSGKVMRRPELFPCLGALLVACSHASPAPPAQGDAAAPEVSATAAASAAISATPPIESAAVSLPSASASATAVLPPAMGPLGSIDDVASQAIDRGDVTGAVVAVVRGGEPAFQRAYGLLSREPDVPMKADTVFDLASLTKALCTAPSILLLVEQKKLRLADPVAKYLPGFAQKGKEAVTVEQLLLHTSGLQSDNAVVEYTRGREEAIHRIEALPLESDPGTKFNYSDLGYIVLGALVEKLSGDPLDAFAKKHFYDPMGMADTGFSPPPAVAARAAPTAHEGDAYLKGTVHDPRARALGGVAGHAGLFSTAADVTRFARMLLNQGELDGTRVLARSTVALMTAPRDLPEEAGKRALGWDVQTKFSGNRGELRGGFGHTGFTGTSLWVDPGSKSAVIVLSSTLYPDGKGDVRRMRREIATVVARGSGPVKAAPPAVAAVASTGSVLTGIDVLERDGFKALAGRKIALVTHAAGRDRKGQSTVDVLKAAPGVTLVALFSPEHGLRSAEDSPVADGKDDRTGLPVYSLYGERTRPTDDQLAGVDTLVYDLQDAGVRFYTYETTLGYLLETAARRKIRIVILDRPNPIGGVRVEGPILDASRTSFTGYHPLPVRHGMTVGELARLFNAERRIGADLQVIGLEGWSREDPFDRTGLVWVDPSPNLRSMTEALLYPGVALLEGTNVSVGRGTDHPFERVGAPWIDGPRLAEALNAASLAGVRFEALTFTPSSSAFARKACGGVAIHVDDRDTMDPVRVGLSIARALKQLYPADWQSKGLLTLLGNQAAYEAFEQGDRVALIAAGWQPDLAAFAKIRERYLLYPARATAP